MNPALLLAELRRAGAAISLRPEGVALRFERGQLSEDLLDAARRSRDPLRDYLAAVAEANRDGSYPVTASQQAVWATYIVDPQNVAYNDVAAVELAGSVTLPRLERALDRIVARHQPLRLRIIDPDGVPFQRFDAPAPVIEQVDVPNWTDADVASLLEKEGREPIDLRKGPCWRVILIVDRASRGVARVALAVVCSHIVMDLWSFYAFVEQLASAYEELGAGEATVPGKPVLSYGEFAIGEQIAPASEERLAYWREALPEQMSAIDFSPGRQRPPRQRFEGEHIRRVLAPDETGRLRAFAADIGTTPFHVVLAALQVVLARYAGHRDFCIGVPVLGRTEEALLDLVGDFVNPVPIRCAACLDMSAADLVIDVRDRMSAALNHEVPFPLLVETMAPARDLSLTPFFQVLLSWHQSQHERGMRSRSSALIHRQIDVAVQHGALTDLVASVTGGETIVFTVARNIATVDREIAEDLVGRWTELVRAFVAAPDRNATDLAVLPRDEEASVLAGPPADSPFVPITALIDRWRERSPGGIAVRCNGRELSYAELYAESDRVLGLLCSAGVGAGDTIAVLLRRDHRLVAALLAVWRRGAAYVPMDLSLPPARVEVMLRRSRAALVLVDDSTKTGVPAAADVAILNLDRAAAANVVPAAESEVTADTRAYVIFTSGSTGEPKGVAVTHRGLAPLAAWSRRTYSEQDLAGVLFSTSICFDITVFELFCTLAAGGTVIVADSILSLPPLPEAAAVTLVNTTPSAADALLRTGTFPQHVRVVNLVGEALPRETVERLRRAAPKARIFNLYGPTEDTCYSTWADVTQYPHRPPIGVPLDGTTAFILDEAQRPVPAGGTGELYLAGDGLADGYVGAEEETAARFAPLRNARPGVRAYRTGDLVRRLPSGALQYVGRLGRQVKVRGFRIELDEIECVLAAHGDLAAAAVVVHDDGREQAVIAYVQPNPGAAIGVEELESFLRARLPNYMVPQHFMFLESLPLNRSGKIDRPALPPPRIEARGGDPTDAVESLLARLWVEVLDVPDVGRTDNFFLLGGHSLKAAQLLARVYRDTGVELPISSVFEFPRLSQLADLLRERLRAVDRPAPDSAQAPTITDASFAEERIWLAEKLQEISPVYNVAVRLDVTGPFDAGAFERALRRLAEDHDALRRSFVEQDGRVMAFLRRPEEIPVARRTLSDAELETAIDREIHQPIDLSEGPPLRALVLEQPGQDVTCLLLVHHIAIDGWSIPLFLKLLGRYYGAAIGAGDAPKRPAIPYSRYAAWQREHLTEERLGPHLDAWRAVLEDASAVAAFPVSDRTRTGPARADGHVHRFSLDPALLAAAKALARDSSVSTFTILLAAFAAFLARASGEQEFMLGTPTAARRREEHENVVGFFVNMMPVPVAVGDDPSLFELVAQTDRAMRFCLDHQDVPFERLVQEFSPVRGLDEAPFFNTVFAFHEDPLEPVALGAATAEPSLLRTRTAKYNFFLQLSERAGRFYGVLESAADLYDESTAAAQAAAFAAMLGDLLRRPGEPVSRASLLDARAAATVERWSDGPRTGFDPNLSVVDAFAAAAAGNGAAVAIEGAEPEAALSYAELDRRSSHLAGGLVGRGVEAGALVAVAGQPSPEMAVAMLGVLKAGCAYLPLDRNSPLPRQEEILQSSGAKLLIMTATASQAPAGVPAATAEALTRSEPCAPRRRSADDTAYVMYTSGSTGTPKGVVIPDRAIIRLVHGATFAPLDRDTRFAFHANLGFDQSTVELWGPLLNGGTAVCLDRDTMLSAPRLRAALRERRIGVMAITPALFMEHVAEEPEVFATVGTMLIGGDIINAVRVAELKAEARPRRLVNAYGPTECTVYATAYEIPVTVDRGERIPIGRPIGNTGAWVADAEGRAVPPCIPGELYLFGPGLAKGYLDRPDLTREKFVLRKMGGLGTQRVYRTGDQVFWTAAGELRFIGRADQQVKIRGFRVEPAEIESVIERVAEVDSCVVDIRQDGESGANIVAYIVPRRGPGSAADPAEQYIGEWSELYRLAYGDQGAATAGGDDFSGWKSSYDGRNIPVDQMLEWADATAARIRSQGPPRRILEIGVGTGLLLRRLAPEAERYVGIDLSPEAIEKARKAAAGLPVDIELHVRRADELQTLPFETFDTVILNSVVQYFPSLEYLEGVLEAAVDRLTDGGTLFVGDMRSLPLAGLFHFSVEAEAAPEDEPTIVGERARRRLELDKELLIAPQYFDRLSVRFSRIAQIQVMPKLTRAENELTNYRFDVIARVGARGTADPEAVWWWGRDVDSAEALAARLREFDGESVCVAGVANPRLDRDLAAFRAAGEAGDATPSADRADAPSPPDLVERLRSEGWHGWVSWARGEADGSFDLLLSRSAEQELRALPGAATASPTNNPVHSIWASSLSPRLHAHAERLLPEHMRPAAYIFLDRIPLNANGKINRKALPRPALAARPGSAEPRTPTEAAVASVWEELLAIPRVGRDDDFFALGGHSLLATRAANRLRQRFEVDMPISVFFERRTVAGVAEWLCEPRDKAAERPRLVAAPAGEPTPASPAQRRLWFLDKIEGDHHPYHLSFALEVCGALDIDALRGAFRAVAEVHEQLRVRFVERDGEPFVEVQPSEDLHLEAIEVEADEVPRRLEREATTPFDLEQEPPFRIAVLRTAPDRHWLLISMHHIISDGWSLGIFSRDLSAAYARLLEGQPAALPISRWRYVDFAYSQTQWIRDGALDDQLAFWREALRQPPALLELPTDRPRRPNLSMRGAEYRATVAPDLTGSLRRVAADADASLFMVLLAAYAVTLARFSGQGDLIVGTAIANRRVAGTEDIFGFFVNTLPLRVRVEAGASFADVLRQVRDFVLEAFEHQEVPFERLVEIANPERSLAYHPLFQTMLVLQNTPEKTLALPGLEVRQIQQPVTAAKFDLTLSITEEPAGLDVAIEYAADLFEAGTIAALWSACAAVLEAAARNPGGAVDRLPLASAEELARVAQWGRRRKRFATPARLHEEFDRRVAAAPEAPAVHDGERTLSYGALAEMSHRVASALAGSGVGRGHKVGLLLQRSAEQIAAIIGVLRTGAAYVPLSPDAPAPRTARTFADSGVAAIVADSAAAVADEIKAVAPVIGLADAIAMGAAPLDPLAEGDAEDLAYIIHTSGTTGSPKGVVTSHRNVLRMFRAAEEVLEFRRDDVWSLFHAYTFDFQVWELWGALLYGGSLVLVDEATTRDPEAMLSLLARRAVTVLNQTPSAFLQLIGSGPASHAAWRTVRTVLLDGEPLDFAAVAEWLAPWAPGGGRLLHTYGITETTIHATWREVTPAEALAERRNLCGRPFADLSLHILDGGGELVPHGVVGEIHIGGDGVAAGYHGDEALTKARFVENKVAPDDGRLYRTGDLGRIVPTGELEVIGRVDHQVKIRGFRIDLVEVERTLAGIDGVARAIAFKSGQRLGAAVEAAPDAGLTEDEVRLAAAALLLPHCVPSLLLLVDRLPLTPNGKIDRRAAAAKATAEAPRKPSAAPVTETERRLAAIWSELTGRSPIGRSDDFFAIGGHSLLCVQLARRIETSFGARPPIARLYESRTLAAMAALVDSGRVPGEETIICLREGDGPSVLLVHPIGGDVLCYRELAAAWPDDARLLALRHPDADADRPPECLPLAEMARRYRAHAVQFLGRVPDLVGGWSFGGSVAHEMVRQWEDAGVAVGGLLLIDSPVPDRSYIARARAMLSDLPDLRGAPLVDALIGHPRFKAIVERDYGIGRLSGLVDAATIEHIMRLHAVNAMALAGHSPGTVTAPLAYALAKRADNAHSLDELSGHLRKLGAGRTDAALFDEDHFSIIRSPAAGRVARFLAGALAGLPVRAETLAAAALP